MGFEPDNRYLDHFLRLRRSHAGVPIDEFQGVLIRELKAIRAQLAERNCDLPTLDSEMRLAIMAARSFRVADFTKIVDSRPSEIDELFTSKLPTADPTDSPAVEGESRPDPNVRVDANVTDEPSSQVVLNRSVVGTLWRAARHYPIQVFATILLFGVVGLSLAAVLKDKYSSTVLILLEAQADPSVGPTVLATTAADSEVEILKSDIVALKVSQRLRLDKDKEFAPQRADEPSRFDGVLAEVRGLIAKMEAEFQKLAGGYGIAATATPTAAPARADARSLDVEAVKLTPAVRKLEANVVVRRRGITDVIAVEATSLDPIRASEVSNMYAEVYLELQRKAKLEKLDVVKSAVAGQAKEYKDEFGTVEAQMRDRLREQYRDSLAQLAALTQKRLMVIPNARVISPALVPDVPSSPPRPLILAFGLILGVLFGLGIAYLRECRFERRNGWLARTGASF